MKITINYNTVYAFATQRNATQRNATQRNATQRIPQLYLLLTNNFKFYKSQFFRTFNFLSAVFDFAEITEDLSLRLLKWIATTSLAKSGQTPNSCSFLSGKKEPRQSQRDAERRRTVVKSHFFFCQKNNYSWITKSIRKNFFALCGKFINLFDASNFEIISQLNYGFCYKNYFFNLNQVFRNNYDFSEEFGRNLNYGFGKDYNYKKNCDYGFEKNYNFGFGKNDLWNCNFGYGFGNEIYGIGNNLKDFLFNRKIKKKSKKLGEQQ